jgi:hypothetical protein
VNERPDNSTTSPLNPALHCLTSFYPHFGGLCVPSPTAGHSPLPHVAADNESLDDLRKAQTNAILSLQFTFFAAERVQPTQKRCFRPSRELGERL